MANKLLLGITGSIAAYKSAELIRQLRDADWDVHVMMTEAAQAFIGVATCQTLSRNKVYTSLFEAVDGWQPEHIALAEEAKAILVAPCTANAIARFANGFADDVLSSTVLTSDCPLILAPAMHENMWNHPATQGNAKRLLGRGVHILGLGEGELACGHEGLGKMAEPAEIAEAVSRIIR